MREWMRRRPAMAFVLLLVVLSAIGDLLVWWGTGLMPAVGSEQGKIVDNAIFFLGYLVVPVFVFVTLVLVFAGTIWRVRDDDRTDSASQVRSHRGSTLAWLGITFALAVLVTVYPGATGIAELTSDAHQTPETLVVEVTAEQWDWSFAYPQYDVAYSDELVLPVDRKVKFVLESEDVIHSFWIPSMRVKKDIIPGDKRALYLTPERVTSTQMNPMARVQCAELCGVGHSQMWAKVRVVEGVDFTTWAHKQAQKPPPMEM